jgi:hypothetical protein
MARLERRGLGRYGVIDLHDAVGTSVIGRGKNADIVMDGDDSISSVHAELDRKPSGWFISDLGSLNGTRLNGEMVDRKLVLRDGDDIELGRTTLTFFDPASRGEGTTKRANRKNPEITKTERLVLVELCRPAFSGRAIAGPASVETISKALVVGQAAVRAHLGHLYDKFGTEEQDGMSKREVLALDVMDRRIITRKDYE